MPKLPIPKIPKPGFFKRISGSIWAASIEAGLLMGAGDVISQTVVEKKTAREISIVRVARFAALGAVFIGPSLRLWYNLLEKIPLKKGMVGFKPALVKMSLDQIAFAPPFYLAFIGLLGITKGQTQAEIKDSVRDEYKDIMIANYAIWPAIQLGNFWWVPLQHRVLFEQTFAIFWNTFLAWKTNRFDTPQEFEIDEVYKTEEAYLRNLEQIEKKLLETDDAHHRIKMEREEEMMKAKYRHQLDKLERKFEMDTKHDIPSSSIHEHHSSHHIHRDHKGDD